MKKIILIIVVLAIVGVIGYFICDSICGHKPQKSISIVFLSYENDSNYFDKIVNEVNSILKDNSGAVNVNIYLQPGKEKSFKIEESEDFSSDKERFDNISQSLKKEFKTNINMSKEQANTQIESLIQSVINSNPDEENCIFLIGSFPNCYNQSDADKAIRTINDKLKKVDSLNKSIYWMLKSSNDEPEQNILKALQKIGLRVENKQISVTKRKCPDTLNKINVDVVILSKIDSLKAGDIVKRIQNEIPVNSNVRIVSMNGVQTVPPNQSITTLLSDVLNKTKSNTFLEARTLLIQTFNTWEKPKDTNSTKIFLIGKVPQPTKGEIQRLKLSPDELKKGGVITTPGQLSKFSNRKNIEFILSLFPHSNGFDFGKELYQKFTEKIIKVKNL